MKDTILTGVDMSEIKDTNINMEGALTDAGTPMSILSSEQILEEMIQQHTIWLQTTGREGKQLDVGQMDLRALRSMTNKKLTLIKAPGTRFIGMNLSYMEIQSSSLERADFRNCDLEEVDMRGSNLTYATFNHANMHGSNFAPLVLSENSEDKRFAPCNMEGAKFRYADLRDAILKGVNLKGADFTNADLTGVDFRGADITNACFEKALMDNVRMDNVIGADTIRKSSAFSLDSLKSEKTS
tara:strand:- start:475 stop:1197 length:723 start_codon:yes stop_codon:yes gene_type:complete